MATSTAKVQETYNKEGYLSALPVLDETELREARHAFSELEKEFGKYHWKLQGTGGSQKIMYRQKLVNITTDMILQLCKTVSEFYVCAFL